MHALSKRQAQQSRGTPFRSSLLFTVTPWKCFFLAQGEIVSGMKLLDVSESAATSASPAAPGAEARVCLFPVADPAAAPADLPEPDGRDFPWMPRFDSEEQGSMSSHFIRAESLSPARAAGGSRFARVYKHALIRGIGLPNCRQSLKPHNEHTFLLHYFTSEKPR